jgi:hypothetical protein
LASLLLFLYRSSWIQLDLRFFRQPRIKSARVRHFKESKATGGREARARSPRPESSLNPWPMRWDRWLLALVARLPRTAIVLGFGTILPMLSRY